MSDVSFLLSALGVGDRSPTPESTAVKHYNVHDTTDVQQYIIRASGAHIIHEIYHISEGKEGPGRICTAGIELQQYRTWILSILY